MATTIIIDNCRLSFAKNLFDPNKKDKRTCNGICNSETKFFRLAEGKKTPVKGKDGLQKLVEEVLAAKFGGKAPSKYENWAFRPNVDAVHSETGERYDGYEDDNGFYVSPSRKKDQGFPGFVRPNGQMIEMNEKGLLEARSLFQAGDYVNLKVNIAAFEVKEDGMTKRGVSCFLEALQYVREGAKFGGGSSDASGFDPVAEEESDEDEDI